MVRRHFTFLPDNRILLAHSTELKFAIPVTLHLYLLRLAANLDVATAFERVFFLVKPASPVELDLKLKLTILLTFTV